MFETFTPLKQSSFLPLEGPYILFNGKKILNFSCLDFLGLAQDPEIKKGGIRYLLKYPLNSFPAALFLQTQKEVESKYAQFLGLPYLYLFPHMKEASLYLLEQTKEYRHPSPLPLWSQLSYYSTDSSEKELRPIQWIHALEKGYQGKIQECIKHNQAVIVNCSSLSGMCSARLAEGFSLPSVANSSSPVLFVGTFLHLLGIPLSYVGSLTPLPSLPCNRAYSSSFFSLSPVDLGFVDACISLLPEINPERERLHSYTKWLLEQLKQFSIPGIEELQLPSILLKVEKEAQISLFMHLMEEHELFLMQIEPSLFKLSLSTLHAPDDLDQLSSFLKKASQALSLSVQACIE